jgi:hypothetical protein
MLSVPHIVHHLCYNNFRKIKNRRSGEEAADEKTKRKQRETKMMYGCRMIYHRGHIEVFDPKGKFLFSADTFQEAQEDLTTLYGD